MRRLILSTICAGLFFATNCSSAAETSEKTTTTVDFPIPRMTPRRTDVAPFTYTDVGKKIPNYTPGEKWGVQGEARSQMQDPLPPEESLKHFIVPEGFHVELFAAEPDLGGKPIAVNWDERGRLWLCETYDYPNEQQPAGEGRDRIRICEDTDLDGRADKFTVFAEQLSIPTSLTFANGGVIVFDGPQTVFLKDTNGDDVADERRVLFGTWNQRDTHAGPSNMRYGLDNWIWATQGYNDSRLVVGDHEHRFRQGILRFRPDGSELEFVRSTDNNTWGLGISEDGLIFASTANRNPSVFMPIPNRYYERVRGWTPSLVLESIADTHLFKPSTVKVRQMDHFGGYTAAAGHALYTARRYPREYWNRTAFVCGPTGHLVGTFVLAPAGAGFRSTSPFNLLSSDDEWCAPTMADVGPDGNMWVVDWYNFIVQHNPTPLGFSTGKGRAYETDLRDKRHARIYRVVYDAPDREPPTRFNLSETAPENLVKALAHSNLFWRRHAQRLLVERNQLDVLPALIELASDHTVDAIGLNVGAIHALWTMHGLSALDGSQPEAMSAAFLALKHPSAGVRRNAIQVLPANEGSLAAMIEGGLLADSDPQVRLAALLAMADGPPRSELGPILVDLAQDESTARDRWIEDAVICAAATNSETFLSAAANVDPPHENLLRISQIVTEHRARSGPHDSVVWLVAPLAKMPPAMAEVVVRGTAAGWPIEQPPALDRVKGALDGIVPRLSLEGRALMVQLVERWGSHHFDRLAAELVATFISRIDDDSVGSKQRVDAARNLMALRGDDVETVDSLLAVITPRMDPELAKGLLNSLAASQSADVGRRMAERLPALTPAVRATGVSVLLARPSWTSTLLNALSDGKLRWSDLSLDQQRALSENPNSAIRKQAKELLSRGGVLPSPDRRKVFTELLPLASQTGDAVRGKEVFLKQCSKCHVHGSDGTRIGPDLTGMAVHSKGELLENILDPSRSVEGNFRVYTLATADGQVLTGLLAAESKAAVELFDAEGKKHAVLRENIDQLVASPKSLMPEGFEKQIEPQALVDLLEFLTQRGKYLPLPLDKVATSVSTRGMFQNLDAPVERLVFDDWKPKSFAGVPFQLVDPQGERVPNAVLLFSPNGSLTAEMPKSVGLPCHAPAKAIHLLGGISGWGHPLGKKGSVSLIVRLHYADGTTEDHELCNGIHLADYIRRVDVPASKFAFDLEGRQLRYLSIRPKRTDPIDRIELVKGPDATAPVVMAVTIEAP